MWVGLGSEVGLEAAFGDGECLVWGRLTFDH
jgi:hypothetical protein